MYPNAQLFMPDKSHAKNAGGQNRTGISPDSAMLNANLLSPDIGPSQGGGMMGNVPNIVQSQDYSLFAASSSPSTPSPQQTSMQTMGQKVSSYNTTTSSNSLNINMSKQSQSPGSTPSYTSLTPWTNSFTSHGSQVLPPPNTDNNSFHLSTMAAGVPRPLNPASLTSRMYKSSPYHNSFSQMNPLQPGSGGKLKTVSGNQQPDAMAAVLPLNSSGEVVMNSMQMQSRENRFKRTAEALQKSGLWDVAMKTGNLIRRNQALQKELEEFKMDALNFLKSVIKSPENRDMIKSVLNNALTAKGAEAKKRPVMGLVVSAAAASAGYKTVTSSSYSDVSSGCSSSGSLSSSPSYSGVPSSQQDSGMLSFNTGVV